MKSRIALLLRLALFSFGILCVVHADSYTSKHVRQDDNTAAGLILILNRDRHAVECKCGVSNKVGERIVGGEITKANEFPWQVGISQGYKRPYCGGTLINNLFVLTAAHCVIGLKAEDTMVLFGEHDINNDADKAFRVQVAKMTAHPKYDDDALINDLGLIQMEKTIPFSDITLPPCLPPPDIDYTGELAMVTGWGMIAEDGDLSPVLRKVEVPIVPLEECRAKHQPEMQILDNVLCATWKAGGKDGCQGDSGGPLTWRNNGRWYLIGVTSWGDGCARPDTPAIYSRVDKHYAWIDEHTENAVVCNN